MSVKKTKARISYTFFWPGLKQNCEDFIKTCRICQMKSRVTYRDRVPIKSIPRADRVFDHFFSLTVLDLYFRVRGPSQSLITHLWLSIVSVDSHFVFH